MNVGLDICWLERGGLRMSGNVIRGRFFMWVDGERGGGKVWEKEP